MTTTLSLYARAVPQVKISLEEYLSYMVGRCRAACSLRYTQQEKDAAHRKNCANKVWRFRSLTHRRTVMDMLHVVQPVAAIGFSLVYLLLGGGFFGAVVVFVLAKALGR
jgi:hypothetical protein